jgi:hypothetical protein
MRVQGQAGNTSYVGNTNGGHGEATTRIEFVALDLNGDGDSTDANEGFIRVYQHLTDPEWVTGDVPADYPARYLENADHCGDWHPGQGFISARNHPAGGHDWQVAVTSASRRCYLGGADTIWGAFDAGPDPRGGVWLPWAGGVSPLVAGRPDGAYLHPINRAMNPTFKGVIFVDGKVAISGTLRGKVTVAATDDIVIADDIEYITDPGAGTCSDRLVQDLRRDGQRVHSWHRVGAEYLHRGRLQQWLQQRGAMRELHKRTRLYLPDRRHHTTAARCSWIDIGPRIHQAVFLRPVRAR